MKGTAFTEINHDFFPGDKSSSLIVFIAAFLDFLLINAHDSKRKTPQLRSGGCVTFRSVGSIISSCFIDTQARTGICKAYTQLFRLYRFKTQQTFVTYSRSFFITFDRQPLISFLIFDHKRFNTLSQRYILLNHNPVHLCRLFESKSQISRHDAVIGSPIGVILSICQGTDIELTSTLIGS